MIDLTAVLLGPFATQHLADMGADVIKVEPPEGDLLRVSGGSMGRDKSMGPIYMAANRNKRSLCLDLKKPAAVRRAEGPDQGRPTSSSTTAGRRRSSGWAWATRT